MVFLVVSSPQNWVISVQYISAVALNSIQVLSKTETLKRIFYLSSSEKVFLLNNSSLLSSIRHDWMKLQNLQEGDSNIHWVCWTFKALFFPFQIFLVLYHVATLSFYLIISFPSLKENTFQPIFGYVPVP